MRARYLLGNADFVKVRGSKHDTGEILNYLLALGAATSGHWQSGHMSPIDARAPDFETPQHADGRGNTQSRYDYPFGITVNALGVRFFDEGEAQHSFTYAKTGRAILTQPGATAWQIYDQTGIRQHRYPHHIANFEEADDIAELARKIGLAPEVLIHTIANFNLACRDDVPFDATRPDGKTTSGLAIPKSNWATRIEKAPFRAYPVTCGITFTFGGVKINPNAQVLNSMHQPIRGLYASGDIVGLFFHNYPVIHRADPQRRVRPSRRNARRRRRLTSRGRVRVPRTRPKDAKARALSPAQKSHSSIFRLEIFLQIFRVGGRLVFLDRHQIAFLIGKV